MQGEAKQRKPCCTRIMRVVTLDKQGSGELTLVGFLNGRP